MSAVRERAGAVPRLGYRDPEPYKDKGEQRGCAKQQRAPTNRSQDASSLTPYSSARTTPGADRIGAGTYTSFVGGWMSGRGPSSEPEGGSAQDVVLGDFDLVEAEQAHHLAQDHGPRDDRRCACRVEAGCLLALLERD